MCARGGWRTSSHNLIPKTYQRQTEKLTLCGPYPIVEMDGVYQKDAVASNTATAASLSPNPCKPYLKS